MKYLNQVDRRVFFKGCYTLIFTILFSYSQVLTAQGKLDFNVGFAQTNGELGGEVIRVTNLHPEGEGSLKAALEKAGPRIVVFEVGGIIDLEKQSISINEPYLTIAGQTAPSPGITLIRGEIRVKTHDVIVQHIRIRPGDGGDLKEMGFEPDGLSTDGANAYNIIIDHCSFSWAVDENLSITGPRTLGPDSTSHKITFSNNIIAEALSNSTHLKGEHSKGTLVHDFCRDIAIFGNLYAHNYDRNPYFKAFTEGVYVNNMIHNPGMNGIQLGFWGKEWEGSGIKPAFAEISIVGNVMRYGPDTKKGLNLVSDKGKAYLDDNLAFDIKGKMIDLTAENIKILKEKPSWPNGLIPMPSKKVKGYVMANAGARPKDRDVVDKRILKEMVKGKGKIIDSQEEVGGYPKQKQTYRKLNIPDSNIEQWLKNYTKEVEE